MNKEADQIIETFFFYFLIDFCFKNCSEGCIYWEIWI